MRSSTENAARPKGRALAVRINPMKLVVPLFAAIEPSIGMLFCTTWAILHGRGEDVWDVVQENFL
jgi:pyruvate dehydrogenase (quinone)